MRSIAIILLVIFLAGPGISATRFYLPSTGAPPVSPAFNSSFCLYTNTDRIRAVTSKILSPMTGKSTGSVSGSGLYPVNRMYVTDPLAAQTVTGTIKGYLLGKKSAASALRFILVKRWSNDGLTMKSYFIGVYATSLDLVNSYTNRGCPTPAYSFTQTFDYGDRMTFEIGYYKTGTAACAMYDLYGDNGASDLPENETSTDQAASPWIEFSQSLSFLGTGGKTIIIDNVKEDQLCAQLK